MANTDFALMYEGEKWKDRTQDFRGRLAALTFKEADGALTAAEAEELAALESRWKIEFRAFLDAIKKPEAERCK
mgnify:CR=1 FL=1